MKHSIQIGKDWEQYHCQLGMDSPALFQENICKTAIIEEQLDGQWEGRVLRGIFRRERIRKGEGKRNEGIFVTGAPWHFLKIPNSIVHHCAPVLLILTLQRLAGEKKQNQYKIISLDTNHPEASRMTNITHGPLHYILTAWLTLHMQRVQFCPGLLSKFRKLKCGTANGCEL